ncbi:MAG: His-Xaa-Ser system protein HxsD [Rikenellaceae bacterium]
MASIEFPVTKIETDKFQISVDSRLYSKEAIVAACYKFSNLYYVHQTVVSDFVEVIFESKNRNNITEVDVKEFCNELLDQQLRCDTNSKFGKIRDMIVEEAFKPINQSR